MGSKIKEKQEIRYKSYSQDITINIPLLLEEAVKSNALVKIVNEVVERIDISSLCVYYNNKGCPPYHPHMLIKVWVYGFCNKIYTSRPLARKLREDLCFMWLAGGQHPCFKTLSTFRGYRMQGMIEDIFKEVLLYLLEHDYIDLDDLYIDGSKWEANANKYKIIWRKNTERYKQAVLERIDALLSEIVDLQNQEDAQYGLKGLKCMEDAAAITLELNSKRLGQTIQQVNDLVALQSNKQQARKLKSLSNKLSKEQRNLRKYEQQEVSLAGRNSYSKTDEDATAMRMKDDALKPGYNPQITTSNQFIVNSSIHQNASDSVTFPAHLGLMEERVVDIVGPVWQPDWTGDAGYGSEENYELLKDKQMQAFLKYPSWYQEQSGKIKKKPYHKYNWEYKESKDYFICPQGRKLLFVEEVERSNKNGFVQQLKIYECESCLDCPVFKACRGERASKDTNRRVRVNENLETHKAKVKASLDSEAGKEKRSKRGVEVETPFGNIKFNMGHRRFILRGLEKVNIEFTLLAIAHNLRKVYCERTGVWKEYYAQRAARSSKKKKKKKKKLNFIEKIGCVLLWWHRSCQSSAQPNHILKIKI